jgi:hypothetical protein
MKYKIIDNFLSKELFDNIKNLLTNNVYFPWYLSHGVSETNDGNIQFCHTFYSNNEKTSNHFNVLEPVLEKFKTDSLVRIKANLLSKTNKIIEHGFHEDITYNNKNLIANTAVYYLNTNNGYTKFKDKNIIVNSVENRMLIFKSNLKHCGTTCTDSDFRAVLNFNYF